MAKVRSEVATMWYVSCPRLFLGTILRSGLHVEEKLHPEVKAWLGKKAAVDIRHFTFCMEKGPKGFRHTGPKCDSLRESFGESVLEGSL